MDLEHLHRELAGDGWRLVGDTLWSPTGDWWVSAGHLRGMQPMDLYGSMARRHQLGAHAELPALLRGLAACSEAVRAVLAVFTAGRAVFVPWCAGRGLALREWEFSEPSLRASARHPSGGVACVEWLVRSPLRCVLLAYHSIDHVGAERRGWTRVVYEGPPVDDLADRLEEAVRLTLTESPLADADGEVSEDDAELPLLR